MAEKGMVLYTFVLELLRNNHANKLSGKVFIVVNPTIGGGQTLLR
jgi:hypothetical protein